MALWPYSPLLALGVLMLSHMLVLYPTLTPNAQWLGPVITRFETTRNEVWLTIDDGPTDDTPALLDLFDAHAVKATFFVKGALAESNPSRIAEMLRRGHVVANHTQTHPSGSFWCLLPGRITEEIESCERILERMQANRQRWFRAPVGMKNPFVHPVLRRRGLKLIGWSARGFDGVKSNSGDVVNRVVRKLAPGAIVVLHQGRDNSRQILEEVIAAVQSRGYAFVIPRDEQLRAA